MHRTWLAVALLLVSAPAWAQPKAAPAGTQEKLSTRLQVPYEKYTLPNGLEVILHEDKRLPVVAVNVWYHVGAFQEPQGRSGFAHLFEHMMFQGSLHVADDQHISMLENLGGTELNGTTNFYRTNYFQTVPANHLETALWLESDRMGFLVPALTDQKLKTQQEVVKNERRQRYETAPYGLAEEKVWQALFPAPHPYNGLVIGSMKDLEAATLQDVKDFFLTWYAPANATLAVAGDFDKAEVRQLIEKYFGSIPSRPEPKLPAVAPVKLEQELVIQHEEQVAPLPGLFLYWHSPALYAPGDAEADVLATILSNGKASRLHRRLVREKRIAQSVAAYQQSLYSQSAFVIEAVAAPGHTAEELKAEIDAVLSEIREKGVTEDEVKRARNRIETSFVGGLQAVGGGGGKADLLQTYNHFFAQPDSFGRDLARYESVTVDGVKAFVTDVLSPSRRVVGVATPPAGQKAPEVKK